MPPELLTIDHVHVHVADRVAAERWYAQALGLERDTALAFWAADGGPLTLRNGDGGVHLALFERRPPGERPAPPTRSTVAFGVGGDDFLRWRAHLAGVLGSAPAVVDHQLAWSFYFSDPDGNPYEITTHDHARVHSALAAAGEA